MALPQVASLTRLHALHLSCISCTSDQYSSLAALSSTLQSLSIDCCLHLPSCLPQMLALRTLVSTEGGMGGSSALLLIQYGGRAARVQCTLRLSLSSSACMWQVIVDWLSRYHDDAEAQNILTFKAALRRLPHLEGLSLGGWDALPPAPVLVPGPWQGTPRQLTARAHLLSASLPALGAAERLQELSIREKDYEEAEKAALQVLHWIAAQQALPLRRVALQHPHWEPPTAAVANACQAVRAQHPHMAVEFDARSDLIRHRLL